MTGSVTDPGERPVVAAARSTTGPTDVRPQAVDRRTARDARLKARHKRRLYALGGLAVLAAFLAAAVIVVDMVR